MKHCKSNSMRPLHLLSPIALAVIASTSPALLAAEQQQVQQKKPEVITVTGSRIQRTELVSSSPVVSVDKAQIHLDRAVNVEDITAKLPQAAAGANSTGATVGDSFGSSTIDLRGLGQNRTLVLIDGTRAVPFSFRNSVDVNTIPAGLIKRVDVLTGGAAAVYGADAVAGVVNFVLDDDFTGAEFSSSYETADGGNEKLNFEAIFGGDIADGSGHITGYLGYSERKELLAGERDYALENGATMINSGGFYTDVASGNSLAINDVGQVVSDRQTSDFTGDRYLTQPMDRFSAGLLFDVDANDSAIIYGRAMYSKVTVNGAGASGQTPIFVNEQVTLTQDNQYIPDELRQQLTFDADGNALVNVERNLGLGVQHTEAMRDSLQFQLGLKGDINDYLRYDIYGQYGQTDEVATIYNNGYKNDNSGNSRFGNIANSSDIFDPNLDPNEFSDPLLYTTRERTQSVFAATLSGDSSALFELPAGYVDFAIGYEYRKETGKQTPGDAFRNGTSFASVSAFDMDANFDSSEFYAELLVPILVDMPFAKELSFEGAYRISDYSNTEAEDTYKLGINWAINDDIRIRANKLTAFRAPNLGEFASPITELSFALFDQSSDQFLLHYAGRFNGDPCLLGTGDAAQCAAFGAPAVGSEFDSSSAAYTYGGNPDIKPEQAESDTLGLVYTPSYIDGFDVSVDYYSIRVTDAVSQIQPAAALQSCYIDDPNPNNPLCGAVLRDPNTGFISTAIANDFNLAAIEQEGIDVAANYVFDAPMALGGRFRLSYQGNFVTKQTRQNNSTVADVDCKGTYGSTCSGDFASILQADYKHRATFDWQLDTMNFQLGWRRIGEVEYAVDRTETIDAQDYIDFAASWQATDTIAVNFGIDNLFDKAPPTPEIGANHFNTVSDYSVIGRTVGVAVRYSPEF
ncbi:TonB-dependent receptor domain-containing protein [Pseudoalteromonas ostreae]|uniref:TonB-dependent receptor domain-containing protein n=1 Tax=Pseudoalteromonas ostreae TaxID=2774154 RepID=UPI001B369C4E|nr:TonB-dependent receptor [Pseudoalteromonas ostreae]